MPPTEPPHPTPDAIPPLQTTPHPAEAPSSAVPPPPWQAAAGGLVILIAALMAWGASSIAEDSGYGGVGPNFLPWVCATVLGLCGVLLIREAVTGGFRDAGDPGGHAQPRWMPFIWVTAGLLSNALLIEHLGFTLGCTLCYLLAVQGLRRAAGQALAASPVGLLKDAFIGLLIAAPVFWLFTAALGLNLPRLNLFGITNGWL